MAFDLSIPAAFAEGVRRHGGETGERWLAALPGLAARLMADWDLERDGDWVRHGYFGLVLPVQRGGEPLVLKVSRPDPEVAVQARVLRALDGRGAVRLLDADTDAGALVVERLDPERTLDTLASEAAARTAGHLLRRLAIAAPDGIPTLQDRAARMPSRWAAGWAALGRPFERRYLDAATEVCRALGPSASAVLVADDLHYGNVLAGTREPWLAIDIRAVAGDLEYGVAPLLWTRYDFAGGMTSRFATIVEAAELDAERARAWTLVRAVDYALWGLERGLTHDPASSLTIADWCLGPGG